MFFPPYIFTCLRSDLPREYFFSCVHVIFSIKTTLASGFRIVLDEKRKKSSQLLIPMNNLINTFIEYLLDTQTTSDVLFNETIARKETPYNRRYLSSYEKIIDRKFQQWKDYYQTEQSTIAKRIALNTGSESSEESSISNAEDDEEKDRQPTKSINHPKDQVRDFNR